MTNLTALKSLCNAIANTFYPDNAVLELALLNAGMDANAEAKAKDRDIFGCAVPLVIGYIESSRTENGISTSVREDALLSSLRHWCGEYGLDADEVLHNSLKVIEDGTHLW